MTCSMFDNIMNLPETENINSCPSKFETDIQQNEAEADTAPSPTTRMLAQGRALMAVESKEGNIPFGVCYHNEHCDDSFCQPDETTSKKGPKDDLKLDGKVPCGNNLPLSPTNSEAASKWRIQRDSETNHHRQVLTVHNSRRQKPRAVKNWNYRHRPDDNLSSTVPNKSRGGLLWYSRTTCCSSGTTSNTQPISRSPVNNTGGGSAGIKSNSAAASSKSRSSPNDQTHVDRMDTLPTFQEEEEEECEKDDDVEERENVVAGTQKQLQQGEEKMDVEAEQERVKDDSREEDGDDHHVIDVEDDPHRHDGLQNDTKKNTETAMDNDEDGKNAFSNSTEEANDEEKANHCADDHDDEHDESPPPRHEVKPHHIKLQRYVLATAVFMLFVLAVGLALLRVEPPSTAPSFAPSASLFTAAATTGDDVAEPSSSPLPTVHVGGST